MKKLLLLFITLNTYCQINDVGVFNFNDYSSYNKCNQATQLSSGLSITTFGNETINTKKVIDNTTYSIEIFGTLTNNNSSHFGFGIKSGNSFRSIMYRGSTGAVQGINYCATTLQTPDFRTSGIGYSVGDRVSVKMTYLGSDKITFQTSNVRLVDRAQRQRSVRDLALPMRERLARIPGITITNVGMKDLGGGKSLQFSVQGRDLAELERLSRQITEKLRDIPGLVDLDTTLKPDKPTIAIDVKRDAASDLGLNVNALAGTLRALLAGQTVGNWRAPNGENYDINVRLAPEKRESIEALRALPINVAPAADGSPRSVRLSQVAEVTPSAVLPQVRSFRALGGSVARALTRQLPWFPRPEASPGVRSNVETLRRSGVWTSVSGRSYAPTQEC